MWVLEIELRSSAGTTYAELSHLSSPQQRFESEEMIANLGLGV